MQSAQIEISLCKDEDPQEYIRRKGEVRVISLQRAEIAGFPPLFETPSALVIHSNINPTQTH